MFQIFEFYERVSGARMHAAYVRPGGVYQVRGHKVMWGQRLTILCLPFVNNYYVRGCIPEADYFFLHVTCVFACTFKKESWDRRVKDVFAAFIHGSVLCRQGLEGTSLNPNVVLYTIMTDFLFGLILREKNWTMWWSLGLKKKEVWMA